MPEAFSWPEGAIYIWTGGAGVTSALVAYAENVSVTMLHGWLNYRTLDSAYHDRHTGQSVELRVGALYTVGNSALQTMFDAKTAVHVHVPYIGGGVSGGVFIYSGRIDDVAVVGQQNDLTRYRFSYHANIWSAYN